MKNKFFTLAFAAFAVLAVCLGQYQAASLGAVGVAFSMSDFKFSNVAFLQIVPGKFVVGQGEEVPYMSRAEKALYDQLITLNRANPVTRDVIAQGGVSFDPITYYIRKTITAGAGQQAIVDNSLIKYVGITNIPNGATLPQFYNFCFDRIAIRYAVTASAAANAAAVVGFSSVRGSMPAALGNGHIIVQSNQNTILETPVSDFTSVAAITGGGERDYDGGVLEKPRFFLELINIRVDFNYATGQSVPSAANNTYTTEVCFHGVQARLKA